MFSRRDPQTQKAPRLSSPALPPSPGPGLFPLSLCAGYRTEFICRRVSLASAFPFLVFFLFLLLFLSHFVCFLSSACSHFSSPSPSTSTSPSSLSVSPRPPCLALFEVEPSGGTPRRRPLSFCPCCVQEGKVNPNLLPTASRGAVATLVKQGPETQLFLLLLLVPGSPVTNPLSMWQSLTRYSIPSTVSGGWGAGAGREQVQVWGDRKSVV